MSRLQNTFQIPRMTYKYINKTSKLWTRNTSVQLWKNSICPPTASVGSHTLKKQMCCGFI